MFCHFLEPSLHSSPGVQKVLILSAETFYWNCLFTSVILISLPHAASSWRWPRPGYPHHSGGQPGLGHGLGVINDSSSFRRSLGLLSLAMSVMFLFTFMSLMFMMSIPLELSSQVWLRWGMMIERGAGLVIRDEHSCPLYHHPHGGELTEITRHDMSQRFCQKKIRIRMESVNWMSRARYEHE